MLTVKKALKIIRQGGGEAHLCHCDTTTSTDQIVVMRRRLDWVFCGGLSP